MPSDDPIETPKQTPKPPRRKRAASEHGSNRRIATALCYDLVGSTELFHLLDIEDYHEMIAAFQGAARQAITSHSGVMRLEAGDGGLALFPVEIGPRDAASLAIRAGFDVIKGCRRVARELRRKDIHVRIGIATSEVLVQEEREDSAAQEPVTGAALAMAARLEAIAPSDSILVSDETRNLAGRSYSFVFEGEHELKGFVRPEKLWRPLGRKNEVDRFYAFGRLGGSFVGRAGELETIQHCWNDALAGGGGLVVIEGDAGIGKSRLLHEIRRLTRERRCGALQFQCSPGGSRSTLHPLLHSFPADVTEAGGQLRVTADAVASQFARQGIRDPEVVDVFTYLLGAVGRPELSSTSDPGTIREKARRAVLPALQALCAKGPTLLAVEDVHWIDPTSQDLLLEAAKVIRALPVLLVVTTRPAPSIDWPPEAEPTRLSLKPLDPDETRQAIKANWPQHRLAALPEFLEVTERISGGVPLFIEGICQWVSEVADADAEKISGKMSDDVSPTHSVAFQGILDERLAHLGPARDIARATAVAGGRATLPLLHAMLPDFGRRSLASGAEMLCETGFLMRIRTKGVTVYGFRHALIHETIYNALLRKQRQALHRLLFAAVSEKPAIAPWLDTGALAEQAASAGLLESAINLFIAAGNESSSRSAIIEASHHLRRALTLCGKVGEGKAVDALQLSVLTALGPILTGLVGLNSLPARKLYERGVAIASRQPREERKNWFPIYWGWWLTGRDFLVMHDRALAVQTMMSGVDDPEIALQVKHCIWAIDFNLGWHRETQDAIKAGLALYDAQSAEKARNVYGGHDAKVCGLGQLALSLWLTGQPEASDRALEDMLSHVARISHAPSTAHALDTEAVSAFYRDDYERLADISARMKVFSKKHMMQSLFGLALLFGGWASAHRDSLADGHQMFREGLSELRRLGAVADLPIYLYMHATMLGLAGKYEKAIEVATDAIKETKATGHAYWLADLYRRRAILRAEGKIKPELVAAELLTAITIAESQGATALLQRASRTTRELGVVIER